jgi:hypothetical protein
MTLQNRPTPAQQVSTAGPYYRATRLLPGLLVKKLWLYRYFMQITSGKSRGKSRESETPLLRVSQ